MNITDTINNNVNDVLYSTSQEQKSETLQESFLEIVNNKKIEVYTRIKSGKSGQSFQIGANSYTETEWKRLIKGFDAIQEKMRSSNKSTNKNSGHNVQNETGANKTSNIYSTNKSDGIHIKNIDMLLAEFTTAIYPANDLEDEDTIYYTFYLPDGIYCKKEGQDGYEWSIEFEDETQYEKVMSFLKDFETQDNLRFACHENFWQDFLEDNIDMDKFNNFLETRVTDGIPNYLNTYETGVGIDREAAKFSQYMNIPGFVSNICYTAEEAFRTFQPPKSASDSNDIGHEVIDLNRMDLYYANHPDEIGKKNQYYNGKWYSMLELAEIWKKESEELFKKGQGAKVSFDKS